MKIQPLADRIVVQRKKEIEKKGGILLPESSKKKPLEGTVLAVGPGAYNDKGALEPMNLKVGDHVLFSNYSGTEYTIDNTEYLLLKEEDVLATL